MQGVEEEEEEEEEQWTWTRALQRLLASENLQKTINNKTKQLNCKNADLLGVLGL